MNDLKDVNALKAIENNDKDGFNQIIARYYDDIYRFLVYKIRNTTDSYDLTQETFFRFIRYFNGYDHRYPLKQYLFKIAVNVANDYFSKSKPEDVGETIEYLVSVQDSDASSVLMKVLMDLPSDQREVIVLNKIYGYTTKEIATMISTNQATVKSRIKLGLDKLKHLYGKEKR